jgi:hypothetical protein
MRFRSMVGLLSVVTAAPACVLVLGDFEKGSPGVAAGAGGLGAGGASSGGASGVGASASGSPASSSSGAAQCNAGTPEPNNCASGLNLHCDATTPVCTGALVPGGRATSTTGGSTGLGIALDSQGNAVVTGYFAGTLDFGDGHPLTASTTYDDAFIAQYSPAGTLNWVVQAKDTGSAQGTAVAVDPSDNVVAVGTFTNQYAFSSSAVTGGPGIYLVKLDKTGKTLGSDAFYGDSAFHQPQSVAVSPDGATVAVAGWTTGMLTIGSKVIPTPAGTDGFVFTVGNDTGITGWVHQVTSSGTDQSLYGVAIDSDNTVVVVGAGLGNVDFGDGAVTAPGSGTNIAVARYAADGAKTVWKQLVGGPGNYQLANGVALGSSGDVFLTGGFEGQITFGAVSLDATGAAPNNLTPFVVRLDKSGAGVWGKAFPSGGSSSGASVAVDAYGVVVGGSFSGSFAAGATTLTGVGGHDAFAMKLTVASGSVLWADAFGDLTTTGEKAAITGVTLDRRDMNPLGGSAVVGYFREKVNVGTGPVSTMGTADMFFARLAP